MQSIRAHILNGRPAPCEHDTLPLARIGTVQPHGVMMVVSPETGTVEHVSANIEQILGVPVQAVLQQRATAAFSDRESVARMEDILRPGRRFFDNPTPLVARGHRFEAICHVRDNKLFIEIEPYVEAAHDYATMVTTAMDAIARQTTVAGLYDAAAQMMHFVTRYDRVKLYKFLNHGHGVVIAEHHAPDTKLPHSFLGYHFAAADIPENAKEILYTGKTRQKPTQRGSVPLLTVGPQGEVRESGQAVDMTDCWLRGIHACDNGYNRNLGVESNIIFPVMVDNALWGLFVVHNRDEKFLNYDSRVVIEQLTMMFISRLVELEAHEARIEDRQRTAAQMLGAVEAGQELLSGLAARRGEHEAMVRMHAMSAVSRHLLALAPTYVSSSGVDHTPPGRNEDKFATDLLRLVDADGAAVVRAGRGAHVHLVGTTPDAVTVRGIASLFGNRLPGFTDGGWRVLATDALADYAPISDEVKAIASGMLAAPIGDRGDLILWFRRERVMEVTWAGKPLTEAELRSEKMFRSRSDFAAARAPLSGASRPWLEAEIQLAGQFAARLGEFWLRCQRGTATPVGAPALAPAMAPAMAPPPSFAPPPPVMAAPFAPMPAMEPAPSFAPEPVPDPEPMGAGFGGVFVETAGGPARWNRIG